MIASSLKPSLNFINGASKLTNHKRLSIERKNQNLIRSLFASIFFLLCIFVAPENPSIEASVCEKYNSSLACQVW
tara:strand:+ start:304 stop:528 length:225 start_codon:yes stop_codon:yes gene_type:complete